MKDFFTTYNNANFRKYARSAIVALTLSVIIVGALQQSWPRSMLLANVLTAGSTEKVEYSADLIAERQGNSLDLRLGKDAYDVDTLTLTLLGDPERLLSVTSRDPSVTVLSNEPGVSLIKVTRTRTPIMAGTIITTLDLTVSGEAVITPIDPVLTSMGQSYSLSVQWWEN